MNFTAQKIKEGLIERAGIKKNYAKLRKGDNISKDIESIPEPASLAADKKRREAEKDNEDDEEADGNDEAEPENTGPHPDRQNLIDEELEAPAQPDPTDRPRERKRRPKVVPFKREYDAAQQRKAEAEERRKAREEAERQKQEKREEREKFRSAMAKARRGGPNGQRKLGRESTVLLERVKKLMG